MRNATKFSPAVDGLDSRIAPSTIAPHFVVVGHPVPVFPKTPGIFVPLASTPTTTTHAAPSVSPTPTPVNTHFYFFPVSKVPGVMLQ